MDCENVLLRGKAIVDAEYNCAKFASEKGGKGYPSLIRLENGNGLENVWS